MANPLPLPLSIQFPSAVSYSGVLLAQLRGFRAETLLVDWYSHRPSGGLNFPGQGLFTPLPSGPVGIEWVNLSGAAGSLKILETDAGDVASGFFRQDNLYSATAPTRDVYVPNGATIRFTLSGVRTYLAITWLCNPATLASGTLRSLTELRNIPSGAGPGVGFVYPSTNGN